MDTPTTDYVSYSSADQTSIVSNLRRNLSNLSMYDALEVVLALTVFGLSYLLAFIWESSFEWERPLPYQLLNDGEVVLDLSLSYPVNANTVTGDMLIFSCAVLPLALMIVIGLLTGPRHDAKAAICSFLVTFGLNFLITHSLKVYCGRFRPNFYQMCQFSDETMECSADSGANAHQSFPSGHSSTAFSGMTLLTLYFIGKSGLHRHEVSPDATWQITFLKRKLLGIASVLPMLYAVFVAGSRVHDFMHHPSDVAVGAMIGFGCATYAYSLWYPSVYSPENAGFPLQLVYERKLSTGDENVVEEEHSASRTDPLVNSQGQPA